MHFETRHCHPLKRFRCISTLMRLKPQTLDMQQPVQTIAAPWACKNDSHFFLTLSFLVSDANDIDTKEEGEEKDEDALSFPIHL